MGTLKPSGIDGAGAAPAPCATCNCMALCAPVVLRPLSRLAVAGLVVGGQAALHLVLSASGGHRGDPAPGPTLVAEPVPVGQPRLPVVDGRRMGSLRDAFESASASAAAGHDAPTHLLDHLTADAPMMLAHTLAALVVGLVLGHGERLLWAFLALVRAHLAVPVTPALPPVPGVAGPRVRPVRHPAPLRPRRAHVMVRRGPPPVLV